MTVPRLSVLVKAGSQRARVERCIASVLTDARPDEVEIIVAEFAPERGPLKGADSPCVRVLHWPAGMRSGVAQARLVHEARAPYVALLEDHVYVHPGWVRAVIDGLDRYVGVGGCVEYANAGNPMGDAAGDTSYRQWRPPQPRSIGTIIPGHNSSYRKDALLRYGRQLPLLLRTDVLLQWRLAQDGHQCLFDPAITISHINDTGFWNHTTGIYHWNRCVGAARPGVEGWSKARRLAYLAMLPAMPIVRLTRQAAWWRRTGHRPTPFLFGVSLFTHCCSAFAQAMGMIAGGSASDRAFLTYELFSYRDDASLDQSRDR